MQNIDDMEIVIPKTEKFLESCQKISDYIKGHLNLSKDVNDEFIAKLLEHTTITRQEAFKSGIAFALGLKPLQEEPKFKN